MSGQPMRRGAAFMIYDNQIGIHSNHALKSLATPCRLHNAPRIHAVEMPCGSRSNSCADVTSFSTRRALTLWPLRSHDAGTEKTRRVDDPFRLGELPPCCAGISARRAWRLMLSLKSCPSPGYLPRPPRTLRDGMCLLCKFSLRCNNVSRSAPLYLAPRIWLAAHHTLQSTAV